ncbi:phytoene/squalene synthase family protein [Stutzerimonas tarimensis]|uniref:Phytoene/squalene synthase family protein n=1 Tax=Stutzerimonas tarimensis TaxID=1507735 RepID=A0ABV7T124_9GAMM
MSDALLDHASQSIAVGSKSFAAAARLFAPETRRSAVMLYAWCRHCDDVIDGQAQGFLRAGGTADETTLAGLEQATRDIYAGHEPEAPAFAALREVVQRHEIPLRYPLDHLAGFRMDVEGRRYETFSDTLEYCYHVAGVVGVMMAMVMGVREQATLDRACDLGVAFQLTNIARDLVEDAANERVYLPDEWLQQVGLARDELASPRHRRALAGLAARLVDEAEPYYDSALGGLPALPLRSAWSIATARAVYREIGMKVRMRGSAAWDQRLSTSGTDKLRLIALAGGQALASRRARVSPRPASLWNRNEATAARHAGAATQP